MPRLPRAKNDFYSSLVQGDVHLGAFSVVDNDPDAAAAPPDRVGEVVLLAEAAERAGLSSLWVAEHHFRGGGGCPSPAVLLASCGARTRRIRLGSLVSVLPFHRPIDVAEEYALLDRLIGGRLNLGVGSGYLPSEFAGFGVEPSAKRELFDRALTTILAAFAGEEFVATPEGSERVRLNVLPVQRPHPPLWIAAQRPEAIPHVGARGVGLALIPYATLSDLRGLREAIASYRRSLPPGIPGRVAAAVHLYAGHHLERARHAFRSYLESRLRTHSTFFEQKVQSSPARASPDALEEADLALFGSPEEVAERLGRYAEVGVDELLGIFDFGGLPPEDVGLSVEALGRAWHARSATGSTTLRP